MEKGNRKVLWIGGVVLFAFLLAVAGIWWFSPTQQQNRRNRALVVACKAGDLKAVQAALKEGADASGSDGNGITPLMYAARGNRPNQESPAATDHPDVVQLLLEHGADCNAATDSGFVALFWAARYGHEKVVRALIDKGADVNAKDNDGLTAMKWANANRSASPQNYDQVIAHLKQAGAKE
ncbi:MAG: putative ankyrin repeat protein [Planctomycetaceae bacterium]|nr:putative ankyrin repeat protein [Planctomycetaceae bacterium]